LFGSSVYAEECYGDCYNSYRAVE